jgi:hypothetical protein
MKRIKIFVEEYSYEALEKRVNDFLATLMPEKVLDIQYRDTDNYCSVLVLYLDEPAIAADGAPRSFDDIYGKE